MSQPTWKLLTSTDYFAIFVDETGVYAPEIELAEDLGSSFEVYRWSLDRLRFDDDGKLCNEHGHCEWFQTCHAGLKSVAESCGRTVRDLEDALASDDIMERAHAYMDIAGYHGAVNFDQYPATDITDDQLTERWS